MEARLLPRLLTDVSSRHDAEARLREAESTFRTMVEQNPAAFYINGIDPDDPTKSLTPYIGPRAEQLTGIPVEQMIADPGAAEDDDPSG